MDEKMERKMLRRRFSAQGWTLLVYYLIMNVCVAGVMLAQTLVEMVQLIAEHGMEYSGRYLDALIGNLMGNAWGYFLASGIGFVILVFWKGKKFVFSELWTPGRPMSVGSFMGITCIMVCGQLVFQLTAGVLEFLFNLFGLSVMGAVESATLEGMDTLSMFLYAGILAPVAEEILFRGVIQRSLMPYGKKFAVLVSAILFGAYHGNLVQSPFAFAVGLVLGYVAAEYSILWAMVLHMFNNLIISDMLGRLTSLIPGALADVVSWAVILVLSAAGVIVLLVRRKEAAAYLRSDRINGKYMSALFSSPGVITLLVVMLATAMMSISAM